MFQLVHNIPCYYNNYIEKMAKRANDKIVSEEITKVKTDIEHINGPNEELVNAKMKKSSYYLKNYLVNIMKIN